MSGAANASALRAVGEPACGLAEPFLVGLLLLLPPAPFSLLPSVAIDLSFLCCCGSPCDGHPSLSSLRAAPAVDHPFLRFRGSPCDGGDSHFSDPCRPSITPSSASADLPAMDVDRHSHSHPALVPHACRVDAAAVLVGEGCPWLGGCCSS